MELFSTTEIEFSYFDILSDNDVREGLKTFGEWPTYPQVKIKHVSNLAISCFNSIFF